MKLTIDTTFAALAVALMCPPSAGCVGMELDTDTHEISRRRGVSGVIFQNGIRFEGIATVTLDHDFPGGLDISHRLDGNTVTFGPSEALIFLAAHELDLLSALGHPAVSDMLVHNEWYRGVVEWLVYVTANEGVVVSTTLTAVDGQQVELYAEGMLGLAPGYALGDQGAPLTDQQAWQVSPFVYAKFNPSHEVCVMVSAAFLDGVDLSELEYTFNGVVGGDATREGETYAIHHAVSWSKTDEGADPESDPESDTIGSNVDTSFYQNTHVGKGVNGVVGAYDCSETAEGMDSNVCLDYDDQGGYFRGLDHGGTYLVDQVAIRLNDDGAGCQVECDVTTDCGAGETCFAQACL